MTKKIPPPKLLKIKPSLSFNIEGIDPKDLLSLYLNKKEYKLNNSDVLEELSKKYNTKKVKSFLEFIKYYNSKSIDNKLGYLYELENKLDMPSNEYVDQLKNNKRL